VSFVPFFASDFLILSTRIQENLKSGELVVSADQWPTFIYQDYKFHADDPWRGAFQSSLLISVRLPSEPSPHTYSKFIRLQAYKHIFTSPSSADKESKATRSGNARIHGMNQVTAASIAYVATQVH
jgi:hypothetical protein